MIIALAGRLKSGKTELSKVCQEHGYKRLYFALPLKNLVAHLINGSIDDVNRLKNVEKEYIFDENNFKYISDETNIPLKIIREKMENKIFHNTREMLQYIGTDIIRHYNNNWHVNKISEMIETNVDYVFDDMRFPNEKAFLDSIGAVSFFVIRPNLEYISNHESETSLKWQDFFNIIINDRNLEYLKFNWENFINNGIIQSIVSKANLLSKVRSDKCIYDELMNTTEPFNMFDSMFISKHEFTYDPKFNFNIDGYFTKNIDKLEKFNNKIFRVYYKNGDVEVVSNPLMIEDLKLYYNENE